MELVLFKDNLGEDSEPLYGILEDRDEPSIICLECGCTIEFGDYEILERLPWQDLSEGIGKQCKNKYVVCMNEEYVRDAQYLKTQDLSQDEFENFDYQDSSNEGLWADMEPNPFIDVIEADSEDEACQKAAELKRYDRRCLYAIKI